jgi:hypothetical protein
MTNKLFISLTTAYFALCATAFSGPLDNAMEFQEKAVQEAEERNNPPRDSDDNAAIGWDGGGSGTEGAVNTGGQSPQSSSAGSSDAWQ